ncbi:phosphatase PAP2 family protein [Aminobacter sp. SR38]|jgi:hypothetical protein|uniref:phosphatase PAP2 family protein n=1 Tax=unclassified Aminobacter TaxID=2644704 RepID=UPI0012AF14C4|nr:MULTISPECIES: phosphatase PAP2 family protein [unclassified Aminobacter]MRX37062.1 hypothetical protein [Aminobacter sp. MDW-2]QNH35035.1 phosphatase PAP2 family protein [Aminobacter sp. MDW-2]QOF70079.1 phosphatase PAP2 family protein [Aminobacter sp. SR38]
MSNADTQHTAVLSAAGSIGFVLNELKLPATVALLYFGAVWLYLGVGSGPMLLHLAKSIAGIFLFWLVAATVLRFIYYVHVARPHRPIVTMFSEAKTVSRNLETIGRGIAILLILSLVCGAFWTMKAQLRDFASIGWDQRLTEIDRIIHLGKLPWEWLQPVAGYWPVTIILNANYQLWLLVMWMMALYFLFAEAACPIRKRYLLGFILTWIVCGSVLAKTFASAGPCYFSPLGIVPNPYAPLMDYLRAIHVDLVPLPALWTQDLLWQGYLGKTEPLGISAMPSLHNAVALLNVLAAWNLSRKLAWLLAVHALLVFVGSVHLGWHYAIDAYVGWAVVIVLWAAAGMLARPAAAAQSAMIETDRRRHA